MQTRLSPWFLVLAAITVVGGVLTVPGTADLARSDHSFLLSAGLLLLVVGGWAMSLCLHEFAHAFVALRGGDWSVRDKGYLTLDIRRYTDIGLSFALPVVFLLLGGIALPGGAVWINHGAIRSRGVRSLVSLAGPVTNLVVGAALTLAVALVPMPLGLAVGLSCLALIQVLAFVLNILPVPGLDGFGVLEPFLPSSARRAVATVRPWAPFVLIALLIGVPGVSAAFFAVSAAVFAAVGGDPDYAFTGYDLLLFWR